jgi:hypothetical protein
MQKSFKLTINLVVFLTSASLFCYSVMVGKVDAQNMEAAPALN